MPRMTRGQFLAKLGRWSYFLLAVIMVMGSFVHLDIKFNSQTCRNNDTSITLRYSCVGRNLIWLLQKQLSIDSNAHTWRTVFNLTPDNFVDIWCPLFLSMLALLQHFQGSKWDIISGSWFRAFCFIMFWMLFGAFGYAGNWGVFTGLFGMCWVNVLYFILIFISIDDEIPVLELDLRPAGVRNANKSTVRSSVYKQDEPRQDQYGNESMAANDNTRAMNMNETINPDDNTNYSNNGDINNNTTKP